MNRSPLTDEEITTTEDWKDLVEGSKKLTGAIVSQIKNSNKSQTTKATKTGKSSNKRTKSDYN